MTLHITTHTDRHRIPGGGMLRAINVCQGGIAATVTARYSAMCHSNILTLAHYPMTAILYEYE